LVSLRHGENFADGAAFDYFFDVPAGLLVWVEEDMHFRNSSKQIVKVTHDVLVSADHENAEIIDFARVNPMKGQGISHVQQIDELGNLPFGITGNIDDSTVGFGWLRQPMNWHDGKELAKGPMIEQRLKDGKVADILVAQRSLELLHFVRNEPQAPVHGDDLGSQLPVNGVYLCF